MSIANRVVSYKRKNWDKSKYKPKRMVNATNDVTQEIINTCKNLGELRNVISNISSELHSPEFSREASQLDYLISEVNKTMSKTSMTIVNDLSNVCNLIAQKNSSLENEITSVKESFSSCEIQLERFSR